MTLSKNLDAILKDQRELFKYFLKVISCTVAIPPFKKSGYWLDVLWKRSNSFLCFLKNQYKCQSRFGPMGATFALMMVNFAGSSTAHNAGRLTSLLTSTKNSNC